jgi:hypothetical protein
LVTTLNSPAENFNRPPAAASDAHSTPTSFISRPSFSMITLVCATASLVHFIFLLLFAFSDAASVTAIF